MMALASAAQAQLFTPGSTFEVQTESAPLTATSTANLTTGVTQVLPLNGLDLTVSRATGTDRAGAEWLVFNYNSNGPISPNQLFWQVNEVDLQLNDPAFLIRGFVQFDVDGVNQPPASSPFSNLHVVAAPPADLASVTSGPGFLGNVNPDTNPADAFPAGR
jgi:hypothetical protein